MLSCHLFVYFFYKFCLLRFFYELQDAISRKPSMSPQDPNKLPDSLLLANCTHSLVSVSDLKQEIHVIQSSKTPISRKPSMSPLDSNKLPDSSHLANSSVKSKLNKAYRNSLAWSCLRPVSQRDDWHWVVHLHLNISTCWVELLAGISYNALHNHGLNVI